MVKFLLKSPTREITCLQDSLARVDDYPDTDTIEGIAQRILFDILSRFDKIPFELRLILVELSDEVIIRLELR